VSYGVWLEISWEGCRLRAPHRLHCRHSCSHQQGLSLFCSSDSTVSSAETVSPGKAHFRPSARLRLPGH